MENPEKYDNWLKYAKKHPVKTACFVILIFVIVIVGAYSTSYFSEKAKQHVNQASPEEGLKKFEDGLKAVKNYIIKSESEKEPKFKIKHDGKIIIPEEGKIYTSQISDKSTVDFMVKDDVIHVNYTTPDGSKWYYVLDEKGNLVDQKIPYKLEEFQVVIPEGMELSRETIPLQNGFRQVRIKLKWGKSINMILDSQDKLKKLDIKGGADINYLEKTISPMLPQKAEK